MTDSQRDALLDQVPAAWNSENEAVDWADACERSGLDPADVRATLGDEFDLADAWYARLGDRVIGQAAGLSAGLKLEDRLGVLVFTLFDAFEAEDAFVRATFDRHGAGWGSPFRDRVARGLEAALDGPDVPGINRAAISLGPIRLSVIELTLQAISAWLRDDSERRERATALVDRLVAFFAEIATNRVAERAVDLVRYAAGAGFVPFFGRKDPGPEGA